MVKQAPMVKTTGLGGGNLYVYLFCLDDIPPPVWRGGNAAPAFIRAMATSPRVVVIVHLNCVYSRAALLESLRLLRAQG